jgi:hypothetical protein
MAETPASGGKKSRAAETNFEKESKAFLSDHPFCFVNIPLGEDEKDGLLESPITPERLAEFLKETVIHQYKLSINWDNKHSCYTVSMTGSKFFRDDYNRCVTSRHNLLWVALAIAEYKFFRFIASSGIEAPSQKSGEIFD